MDFRYLKALESNFEMPVVYCACLSHANQRQLISASEAVGDVVVAMSRDLHLRNRGTEPQEYTEIC